MKIYNTLYAEVFTDDGYSYTVSPMDYYNELMQALENDDTDLADYAMNPKVKSIRMGAEIINGELYGVATCEVADGWTDEDTEWLKKYLTGQYSDGWGEGFEQHELASWEELETSEEYDEEADECYESEYYIRHEVFISYWQPYDFRIMTEKEL